MNRKTMSGLVVVLAVLLPLQAVAAWQKLESQMIGGTLSGRYGMAFGHAAGDQVVLFGGYDGSYKNDTWVHDLSDNRWIKSPVAVGGGTLSERQLMVATALPGDRVLFFGGNYFSSNYSDTWLYNHSQNKWSKLNPTISGDGWTGKYAASLAYLGGDKVLLFGGIRVSTRYNATWLLDLAANTWTLLTPTVNGGELTARGGAGMANVGEGKVILFGGSDNNTKYNETWLYDQQENSWTLLTPEVRGGGVFLARSNMGLVNIGGDRLLMFGGLTGGSSGENDLWLYDYSENAWTIFDDESLAPASRYDLGFAAIGPGRALLFGGRNGSTFYDDTWLFTLPDAAIATFAATADSNGVELSWSQDQQIVGNTFYVYKNNQPISAAITTGTEDNGRIRFSFVDSEATAGTLIRYQLLEVNAPMSSEVFSDEIVVPYCD